MRCRRCVLEDPAASGALDDFLEQLTRCDECPLQGEAASPVVRLLVARHREGAAALRKLGHRARRAEGELKELESEIGRYESRITLLEGLQRASSNETEEELREKEAELQAKMDLVQRQEEAILALSTPIIHVWEGVLVLPVIGSLDARRAETLMESLLAEVQESGATHAILDLTGVDEVTDRTADHIARVSAAVALLGARVILTGLRPRVAQAMVAIGVDLAAVATVRSVKEALRLVRGGARAAARAP